MEIKKAFGQVFGAKLTSAEKKALDIEIHKQLAENSRKHAMEIDAMFLYVLQEQLGFGEVRLKRFFDDFSPIVHGLSERYEMDTEEDKIWLYTYKLKERGVDLEKWYAEKFGSEVKT